MNEVELKYAGFWVRFASQILDLIILLPISGICIWGLSYYHFQAFYIVPGVLISIFYHVYLPFKYGGTPGKLIMKTRIRNLDGSPIIFMTAFIRFAPLLILSFLGSVGLLIANYSMTPDEFYAYHGSVNKALAMTKRAPSWHHITTILLQVWVWSEVVVILFNRKRRAPHDFIAGTVVVQQATTASALAT